MQWYFEDFIYGSIDGAVTTFAIVAGAIGASLSPSIILILGFANLFADGFAMAIGNYQASKARIEYIAKQKKKEEWEIDNLKSQEEQEIRDIYSKKGFDGNLLEDIVSVITSRRKIWIDTMMKEELGLIEDGRKPKDTAISTFTGFNIIGIIPLIPFIILHFIGFQTPTNISLFFSVSFTCIAFFLTGVIRGKIVQKHWLRAGSSTLLLGGIAALVAYVIGYLLGTLILE